MHQSYTYFKNGSSYVGSRHTYSHYYNSSYNSSYAGYDSYSSWSPSSGWNENSAWQGSQSLPLHGGESRSLGSSRRDLRSDLQSTNRSKPLSMGQCHAPKRLGYSFDSLSPKRDQVKEFGNSFGKVASAAKKKPNSTVFNKRLDDDDVVDSTVFKKRLDDDDAVDGSTPSNSENINPGNNNINSGDLALETRASKTMKISVRDLALEARFAKTVDQQMRIVTKMRAREAGVLAPPVKNRECNRVEV